MFNSPTESLQDINSIPIAPYERFSCNSHDSFHTAAGEIPNMGNSRQHLNRSHNESDDEDDSDDTLVDGVSIASSCVISEGGDTYKCARNDLFDLDDDIECANRSELIDFNEIECDKIDTLIIPVNARKNGR